MAHYALAFLLFPSLAPVLFPSLITDKLTLFEATSAFWWGKRDGSDDEGILSLFLTRVLYCGVGEEPILDPALAEVEFYQSHKAVVDQAAELSFRVRSNAPVYFFRRFSWYPPFILLPIPFCPLPGTCHVYF